MLVQCEGKPHIPSFASMYNNHGKGFIEEVKIVPICAYPRVVRLIAPLAALGLLQLLHLLHPQLELLVLALFV